MEKLALPLKGSATQPVHGPGFAPGIGALGAAETRLTEVNKMMTQLRTIGGLVAVATLTAGLATAQLPSCTGSPALLPDHYQYATKFVCGLHDGFGRDAFGNPVSLLPPREPPVKRGNYATVINIHNSLPNTINMCKKVALAAPERTPAVTTAAALTLPVNPTKRVQESLASDHVMSLDCNEIVNLLVNNGTPVPPGVTFIEGFVVIESWSASGGALVAADIDVATVTTTHNFGLSNDTPHHEVTTVQGKRFPAGSWPNP